MAASYNWTSESVSFGESVSPTDTSDFYMYYDTPIPLFGSATVEYNYGNALSIESYRTRNTSGALYCHIARFTAPYDGLYEFSFTIVVVNNHTAGDYIGLSFVKNRDSPSDGSSTPSEIASAPVIGAVTSGVYSAGSTISFSSTVTLKLNKGDFIIPYARSVFESAISNGGGMHFSGRFIG